MVIRKSHSHSFGSTTIQGLWVWWFHFSETQLEELHIYDNSDSEEEKKPLKAKIKRGKCYGSNEQILFARTARPSAPLGKLPPFDPETPWDDGFMLKPQVTVPNPISPFHREVCMAQLQGDEDALALPVIVTQVPPRPQFPHKGLNYDYNPSPFKTIKEIKQACTQYGTNSPYIWDWFKVCHRQKDWSLMIGRWLLGPV